MNHHCLAAAVAAALLQTVMFASAGAQRAADPALQAFRESAVADSIGARAGELVTGIRKDLDVSDRYFQKLAVASHEDSLVIRSQLFTLQTNSMRSLHELANQLVAAERKTPRPELRQEVVRTFDATTPRLWRYILMARGQIDALRAQRYRTPPAARSALEDRIARLTQRVGTAFEIGHEHLARRALLGIATAADSAAFTALVNDRADELSGRIGLSAERIAELEARQKDAPDDADTRALLLAERKSLKTETMSMSALLTIRNAMKLPSEDYRAQLVLVTRDLASGGMSLDVARRLAGRTWDRMRVWLRTTGPALLVKVLVLAGILVLFRMLARVMRGAVGKALDRRPGGSVLLRRMALQATGTLVMIIGLIVALGQIGISVGPMVAGLGVAGFIVGFALQDTLANFAAGLMILLYRPYDVGDVVDVTGAYGKVNKMSLVSTTITTFDNQTIVVPNKRIWGDVIKNVTHQTLRRVDMVFGISYADDVPKAENVLADIIRQHPKVLADPAPVVKVHKLNESSVDFIVRPWVATDDYWDVYWDVTREVKMRFDREGISIPFPQRDVHLHQKS